MSVQATIAEGLLGTFNEAGVFEASDIHVARRLTAMAKESDESVALAVAIVVRALRGGSVCVDLRSVAAQLEMPELPWPSPDAWLQAVQASPLVTEKPVLRLFGDLLYMDRYWLEEQQVCEDVLTLLTSTLAGEVPSLERLFPKGWEEQRAAAEVALTQSLTVLTGGPGTGKTTTVARLLALLAEQASLSGRPPLRIALAAPTGKAAARLLEAVQLEVDKLDAVDRDRLPELKASTLHRLLRSRPDNSSRFRHHRENRLPHDVIVVDETSMVSLTLMARLLEALRPDSRLLLVGDPDQLASVEAGAVLADMVDGLGERTDVRIAALKTSHRFGKSIGALASAIRAGDADEVIALLQAGGDHIEWLDTDDPAECLRKVLLPHALRLREAAILGDVKAALSTLDEHRLLCAHRRGPYGVRFWNHQVERWLTDATGEPLWTRVVRGQARAGDAQRLRAGSVQRRYRRDRGARRRAARRRRRGRRTDRVRDRPAVRCRDHARHDDPQVAGQPGGRGHRPAAAGRLAAADPRAVLHRSHPGEGEDPGDRPRGVGANGGAAPRGSCVRTGEPPARGLDAISAC